MFVDGIKNTKNKCSTRNKEKKFGDVAMFVRIDSVIRANQVILPVTIATLPSNRISAMMNECDDVRRFECNQKLAY